MLRSVFKWAMLLLFLKILIAALFPVLGDEAYYFYWGLHPAGGYYDLPPMIGWWLIPLTQISLNPLWLRLPNLLVMILLSFGVYEWIRPGVGQDRSKLIALLFFFLPLPFFSVLMFPDLPLLYLSFYASLLFYRAVTDRLAGLRAMEFFLSGVLLGAAFLAKYFAVLLIPAFGLWFLFQKRKSWWGLLLFGLGAAPFLFQHLYWNQNHCWANFVFNLISRQKAYDGSVQQTFGLYVVYLLIVSTPLLWGAFKGRVHFALEAGLEKAEELQQLDRFFMFLWSIPVLLFAGTALMGKGQGLHWLLFLTPYFVMWAGLRFTAETLILKLKRLMQVTGVLAFIIVLILAFPGPTISRYFEKRFAFEYSLIENPSDLPPLLEPILQDSAMAFTEGYTLSSVIQYQLKRYQAHHEAYFPEVSVWGGGSRFGRVFDFTTDWKSLDGKTLTVMTPGPIETQYWSQFFSTLKNSTLLFKGHTIYLMRGEGFRASLYLEKELKPTVQKFYPHFAPGYCSLRDGI